MNARLAKFSIPLLRWTLGWVVTLESGPFIFFLAPLTSSPRRDYPPGSVQFLAAPKSLPRFYFLCP
jgi:hypothetical protein